MAKKLLDEKGFVFLDENKRPYRVCMFGGIPMLFYWHTDKSWVSLRRVSQFEIWGFPRNLTQEQQDLYNDIHEKSMNFIPSPKDEVKE